MANIARNRIIYSSQAVYISPSSTGYHLQSGAGGGGAGTDDNFGSNWTGVTGRTNTANETPSGLEVTQYRSLIQPLHRVQSANFSFSVNREDIIEFGGGARLDTLVMEAPTVNLDLSYYAIDGGNERKLGFNIPSSIIRDVNLASVVHHTGDLCNSGKSSLSGHLEDVQGNNYFIAVSKEGLDAAGNSTLTAATDEFDVIAIGNGFISDYSVEASVGSIPSVSVSVEAFNIKADDHVSGTLPGQDPTIPAVDVTGGTTGTYGSAKHYIIPTYQTGILDSAGATATLSALKPGDIELTISSASSYQGITDLDLAGKAHIQSFSLSIPMSRTVLQRLGSTFGYARVIDVPLTISCSISAVVSELQASAAGSTKANVYEMLCSNQLHDLTLSLNSKCGGADVKQLKYIVKNARMEGESFSNSIGSDQTVDISFTAQVGGANDTANGVIMEGNYEAWTSLSYWPIGAQKDDDASYGV